MNLYMQARQLPTSSSRCETGVIYHTPSPIYLFCFSKSQFMLVFTSISIRSQNCLLFKSDFFVQNQSYSLTFLNTSYFIAFNLSAQIILKGFGSSGFAPQNVLVAFFTTEDDDFLMITLLLVKETYFFKGFVYILRTYDLFYIGFSFILFIGDTY